MEVQELLEQLSAFEPKQLPVISLYLNAQANEHGRRNFEVFVRKELAERDRTYAPHTAERDSFDQDLVRINRYLEQEVLTPSQGIAVFACAGADDFFEAIQLEGPNQREQDFCVRAPPPLSTRASDGPVSPLCRVVG